MNRFCLYILLLVSAGIQAQQKITFFNKGELYVRDSLYIIGDFRAGEASKVYQTGTTALTGDFINEVTTGHVFTTDANENKGTFEFCGTTKQQIMGTASKERYINFPDTLRINSKATADTTVVMHPGIAATTKIVDIRRGRLILDSEAGTNNSVNAHLLVEKDVITHPNAIQVNLALGNNYQSKKLVGFTPPFEKLYADYFFFNFLSRPTAKGLFGNDGRLITNPRTLLKPGQGYIVGMGIVPDGDPYYTNELDPRWSNADFSKRAKEKFFFSRVMAEPTFAQYLNEQVAPGYVTGEKLVVSNVTIPLEKGFNYLGNPYMAPLDLSDIINGATSAAEWGVAVNTLKKGFYVLSQGTGSYADSKFTFSASYLISQEQGSTHNSKSVAPMQMFIVGTETPTTLTIPKSKRRHDASATFLRSANYEITDELLLETTDNETGAYDRLCIVFRNGATLQSGDPFDAEKIFNRSGGVNQIYTRSLDDKDMTVSVVPSSTEKLPMYFVPSLLPQQVTLKADRLNSLVSVSYVTLEDTKTGTLTDLIRTPSYTFASSPSDKPDRFVLHFTSNSTGTDNVNRSATPSASYEGGIIRIYGLKESDRGSEVSIFNMQGQLIHRQPLEETTPCLIRKNLAGGVYVVRNQGAVMKFVVK
ncbi:MAG: hypothetical protein LBB84_12115 [Tannerellaceae bacterium]|jgi:hypothetical protein|nr:hypothetical protein [Tannerellaceae bacterium]